MVAGVSALVAVTVTDRVFHARDERATTRQRRSDVLDALAAVTPGDRDDTLGLLRADRSPMPYRGRRRELKWLADWCADDSACPVFMISGSSGVGKSRLALEFASGLPKGWVAGWLHAGAGENAVGAVRACGDPAVILVDDAEGRADLVAFLDALAEQYSNPATRVILLTRAAAGLSSVLASRLDERHGWIVASAPVLDLHPDIGEQDRERWFTEAVTAFAAALDVAVPDLPAWADSGPPDPSQPILVLLAQALLAVLGAPGIEGDPRKLSLCQVAEALVGREKRRWRAMAATWDWGIGGPPSEVLQGNSIAALCLLGSARSGTAEQVLLRVPKLRDAHAERLADITSWIMALYPPGPQGAPTIRPDMIGEWFVVTELTDHPVLTRSLCNELPDIQAARAIAFLARAADRIEAASSLLDQFADGDLRRQILAAVQVAITGGYAGEYLSDRAVAERIRSADGWTIDQLTWLDRLIPRYVLPLNHVAIGELLVQVWRSLAKDDPNRADLAGALGKLGSSLYGVARYQDALAATEEALSLHRVLAEDNPGAFTMEIAAELSNLGVQLEAVGRLQDSLDVTEESVTLFRTLAEENPDVHRASLALALNNLSVRFDTVGRYKDALAAAEESVTIRRALAEENPDVHRANLAFALNNLSVRFDTVGRYKDALAAAEESVTIRRALAEKNPVAHQADLAAALDTFGTRLNDAGRHQEALVTAKEAVTLYRLLAKDNPLVHQAKLAAALTNLGIGFLHVGHRQAMLAATEEAVTLFRTLPEDIVAVHRANFVRTLGSLANSFDQVGRYQDALDVTEQAITMWRAMVGDNPAAHQASLAGALNNLGVRLLRKPGQQQAALAATEEAIALVQALAEDHPAAYQVDLARSLGNLANILYQVGRHQDALDARIKSADIYRGLASRNPDLYKDKYRQSQSALRREHEQHGKHNDAILTHLDTPDQSPPPSE
jgi:tetratricopeptide (TPR) repeat protein